MSFHDDKAVGRSGEDRVCSFLRAKGYMVEFIGQENGKWRNKDHAGDYTAPDIKVVSHASGGDKWLVGKTIEIKTSNSAIHTGCFHIELLSNVGSGRLGWGYTTNADYVGFLSAGDGQFCIVPVPAIRKALAAEWHSIRPSCIPDGYITQWTLRVPIEGIKSIAKHCEVIP